MTTDTDGMAEYYGYYQITQFYPTIYYGKIKYDCLPEQEADMMIGQEITIKEDFFNTYDNNRRPNSRIADRLEDGFWIEEVKIEHTEYCIERKYRKDIYGLRDNMLPDQITQQEYIEIDVYTGYYAGDNTLPQLFVTEDGKIILYAMGEYFLLKKVNKHYNLRRIIMKKIKRMYIIIILIFISIISRYKFRNIEREDTGQTA